MDNLIMEQLKATNILSSRNVLDLKKYISLKYADLTPKEKANILSDAIRKTIDKRIPKVEKSLKINLINNIINTSVNQGSFDINSEDVFIECLNLKYNLNEDIFLSELCSWLNNLTEKNIEKENMKKFIHSVYSLDVKTYNSESISTVLESALQEKFSDYPDSDISNDMSEKYFESEHLSKQAEIDTNCQLNTEKTKKPEVMSILDKVLEKNYRIIEIEWFNKAFMFKNIAIAMSLLLVFLLKTNTIGNNYIIGSDTNSGKNNPQSIALNTFDPKNFHWYIEETKIESTYIKNITMKATAYDLSIECCGKPRNHPLYGITSSGKRAAVRRTVAVDPSVIPLGSKLYIKFPKAYSSLDGVYIAEDTGSKIKGNSVDIFLGEDKIGESIVHKKADNFGVQMVEVSLMKIF